MHNKSLKMYKCNNDSVCVENKNLLTNFKKEMRPLYEMAIKKYGKDDVFITEDAYWENGHRDDSMCALRKTRDGDYSEFWRVFREVEESDKSRTLMALIKIGAKIRT